MIPRLYRPSLFSPLFPSSSSSSSLPSSSSSSLPSLPPSRKLTFTSPTSSGVGFYDFRRYEELYNQGKKIRFPLASLEISPFIRPEIDETDEEVLEKQLLQHRLPLNAAIDQYMEEKNDMVRHTPDALIGNTKHADELFIGISYHPGTKKIERYLLKFFKPTAQATKNARREMVFSYLCVEGGLGAHAPKIGIFHRMGYTFILRRFYRGIDGRALGQGDVEYPDVPLQTLVENYAFRYILFGDLDFNNPGNILFSRHSTLTQEVLVHMDGEDIMPDEDSMKQFMETDWTPGTPIPGSLQWREEMTKLHTPDRFFRRTLNTENALLTYIRRICHKEEEIAKLELSREFVGRVLEGKEWYEKLARSFDIFSSQDLTDGKADFQQTLEKWQSLYDRKEPFTLFNLITAQYSGDSHYGGGSDETSEEESG